MNYWHMQLHPNDDSNFPPETIRKILEQTHYIGIGKGFNDTIEGQFRDVLQIGDIVLIRSKGPLALCEVIGPLEVLKRKDVNPNFDWFQNRRKVKILGWIDDYEKQIGRTVDGITFATSFARVVTGSNFIKKWHTLCCKDTTMEDMRKSLEENKNLILTGAPGTGKTYFAKQIAEAMNAEICFTQFHPSYDYTDFVEGLRPVQSVGSNSIGFKLENGIFKDFCIKAMDKVGKRNFVFIIDEINRGEISKIFGELFFSIEPSYRGTKGKVQTQYANIQSDETIFDRNLGKGWFYVPENVYIIGTMNDIDRSVETFDFAMRRRFIWEEITAEQSADRMGLPKETKARMASLNTKISGIDCLNTSYHIGGAYFLDKDGNPRTDYDTIWNLRLKPLLKEYLRGMSDTEKNLENLKGAYDAKADNGQ